MMGGCLYNISVVVEIAALVLCVQFEVVKAPLESLNCQLQVRT
jgi:hypothetical protein